MNSCSFSCTNYVNQLIHKNYRISSNNRQGQPGKEDSNFFFLCASKGVYNSREEIVPAKFYNLGEWGAITLKKGGGQFERRVFT